MRTIKAQGGLYTGPFHWETRPFTTAELKRLQTFPDGYTITGGRQAIIEQIGNSVPPQLARILALSILNQVFGVALPINLPTLAPHAQLGFRRRKRERTQQYAQKAACAIRKMQAVESATLPVVHSYKGFLIEGFGWAESRNGSQAVPVRVKREAGRWEIFLKSADDGDGRGFEIEVESARSRDWGIEPKLVLLKGQSLSKTTYIAAWKAFEYELITQRIKGDLVQLCGYYQYPPSLAARLRFDGADAPTPAWKIAQQVVSGVGVRQALPLTSFAQLWEVPSEEARRAMYFLRELGYEVRNNHTNPQIPSGWYLIPYPFPSLTPMSVQLRKSLDPAHAG